MPVVNVAAYLFIFLLPHFMLSEWRTGIVSHEPASVDASNLKASFGLLGRFGKQIAHSAGKGDRDFLAEALQR